MIERHFALFETAIGTCGIVWGPRGICGVQLPEGSSVKTRARLQRRHPGAQEAPASAQVQQAIDGIIALLRGERVSFNGVELDFGDAPAFNRKIYDIARRIPAGQTMTYGEIAEQLGDRSLARDVGTALGANPIPIIMPCHRVVAASGKTGGFSAAGGVVTKLRLLTIEGAEPGGPTLFGGLPLQARRQRLRAARHR